jgi:uncharacterized repeat protein (TIGR01451 family)
MKNLLMRLTRCTQIVLAGLLSVTLPGLSWASISNTAIANYSDASGNTYPAASSLTVTTLHLPAITSAATANGQLGVAFTYTITASGGPITSYSAAPLPGGLTLNANSGVISGTPRTAGTTVATVTATNADGTSAAFTLTITIAAGVPNVVITKTADKASAISTDKITYTITYQNTGTGNATNVTIQDVIPSGTTLVAGSITGGGTVSGGTITWSIGTVNAGAAAANVSFQVTVN